MEDTSRKWKIYLCCAWSWRLPHIWLKRNHFTFLSCGLLLRKCATTFVGTTCQLVFSIVNSWINLKRDYVIRRLFIAWIYLRCKVFDKERPFSPHWFVVNRYIVETKVILILKVEIGLKIYSRTEKKSIYVWKRSLKDFFYQRNTNVN